MARRGQNEGSIYRRKDGRWVGVIHLGYEDGKRRRKYVYAPTRAELKERFNKALNAAG
jgi:hypothetical protein